MVSLTCTTDRRDGVTLVTARLSGSGVTQRVRLANRLDGPVWPPRRQGVPVSGWDEDCFETVVPADGTVAVGYASPAPPVDSPMVIVDRAVVDDAADTEDRQDSTTADDALRDLGDPSPPRDAVPIPIADAGDDSEKRDRGTPDGSGTGRPIERPAEPDAERSPRAAAENGSTQLTSQAGPHPSRRGDDEVPEAVAAWLDDVEQRIATAERLAAAETVPEATAAIREVGSLEDAGRLVETLRDDAAALESIADRAERLADRTAATDVPLETFRRLA